MVYTVRGIDINPSYWYNCCNRELGMIEVGPELAKVLLSVVSLLGVAVFFWFIVR